MGCHGIGSPDRTKSSFHVHTKEGALAAILTGFYGSGRDQFGCRQNEPLFFNFWCFGRRAPGTDGIRRRSRLRPGEKPGKTEDLSRVTCPQGQVAKGSLRLRGPDSGLATDGSSDLVGNSRRENTRSKRTIRTVLVAPRRKLRPSAFCDGLACRGRFRPVRQGRPLPSPLRSRFGPRTGCVEFRDSGGRQFSSSVHVGDGSVRTTTTQGRSGEWVSRIREWPARYI
jgi:hypothetical protein